MDTAARESALALERSGLAAWTALPAGFWGASRYPDDRARTGVT